MYQSIFFILLISVVSIACQNEEAAKEFYGQAQDVYHFSKLDGETKTDSALLLVNKALDEYDENVAALYFKSNLLFRKRDSVELIKVLDRLIALHPKKPFNYVAKGNYLLWMGKVKESKKLMDKALEMYDSYLNKDSTDINLHYEYINALITDGDTAKAHVHLNNLKKGQWPNDQNMTIELYEQGFDNYNVYFVKRCQMFWKGEISYQELEQIQTDI